MSLVTDAPYHKVCYKIIGAAMDVHNKLAYLAATAKPVGLLLNFGRKYLEYRRIFPPKKLEGWQGRIE